MIAPRRDFYGYLICYFIGLSITLGLGYASAQTGTVDYVFSGLIGYSLSLTCWYGVNITKGYLRKNRMILRRDNNQCVFCGYQLDSTLGPRCPECGHRSRWIRSAVLHTWYEKNHYALLLLAGVLCGVGLSTFFA